MSKTVSLLAVAMCGWLFLNGTVPSTAYAAQNDAKNRSDVVPYAGSIEDTLKAAAAGNTLPMTSVDVFAGKDGKKYKSTFVGAPLNVPITSGTTVVNVLIVPIIVKIGSTVFDPVAPDSCIVNHLSPLKAFAQSPLIKKVYFDGRQSAGHAALVNGENVGPATYADALRRAEFWWGMQGTKYHVGFSVKVRPAWTIPASVVQSMGGGRVLTSDCAPLGVLPTANFQDYIQNSVIPKIAAITPKTFTVFVLKDVATAIDPNAGCSNFCTLGYHSAVGSPAKTFAVAEYDTTKNLWSQPGTTDIAPLAHEIGAWIDDPLATNAAPPWGRIGLIGACETKWEPGDPLNGINFPAIKMPNGLTYHPQELAFYSWYFMAPGTTSFGGCGAGNKCSMNGTFSGPSKACPPGGSY
jgi:hypothetical protein